MLHRLSRKEVDLMMKKIVAAVLGLSFVALTTVVPVFAEPGECPQEGVCKPKPHPKPDPK